MGSNGFTYPKDGFIAFTDPHTVVQPQASERVLRMSSEEIAENRKRFELRDGSKGRQVKMYDNKLKKDVFGTFQAAHPDSNEKVFVSNLEIDQN